MRAEHMTERERGSRELTITRAEVVLDHHTCWYVRDARK